MLILDSRRLFKSIESLIKLIDSKVLIKIIRLLYVNILLNIAIEKDYFNIYLF